MKIKITKTMAKTLNEYAKNRPFDFYYRENTIDFYRVNVDCDIFNNEIDYNSNTGKMKYISCVYDPELYAVSRAITTNDLINFYTPGDTLTSYCNRVIENMEI